MLDGPGALAAISREVPQDTKRISIRGAQACEEHKSRFIGVSFPEVFHRRWYLKLPILYPLVVVTPHQL